MATEKSFADRLQRGQQLQALIASFTPAFAPSDADLTAGAFQTFLEDLDELTQEVAATDASLSEAVYDRQTLTQNLKVVALRVKDLVQSNVAWKKWHRSVGAAADKVRGYVLPKKDARPRTDPPPNTPPRRAPSGSLSQQSYGDVEKLFAKLIEAVKKIPTYAPPVDSGLGLTDLQGLASQMVDVNDLCAQQEANYREAVRARLEPFEDPETGLNAKMKAIKKAVRAQYGASSLPYAGVRTIRV
jgi:hypothetical protein